MAIEKNAVRKDTRWMFCGHVVVVEEVTAEFVIFRKHDAYGLTEVATLRKFLACARDPATAEHERLLDGLLHASHGEPSDSPMGTFLGLLRDAAIWHLERTYPAAPVYLAPVAPPKPAPVEDKPAEAKPVEEAVEDYAVALPCCETLPEDKPVDRKRRFA